MHTGYNLPVLLRWENTICTNISICTGVKTLQDLAGCVQACRNQVCNCHPEPIHCCFPLHYTSQWFLWPQRTGQKFSLCWWPTIPPLVKKNYTEKYCFVTVSMEKSLYDDLFWLTVLSYIPVRPWFLLSRTSSEAGRNLCEHPGPSIQHLNATERCILPALETFSLPVSYQVLNYFLKKMYIKSSVILKV